MHFKVLLVWHNNDGFKFIGNLNVIYDKDSNYIANLSNTSSMGMRRYIQSRDMCLFKLMNDIYKHQKSQKFALFLPINDGKETFSC